MTTMKQIPVTQGDAKIYDKIAKAMSEQVGVRIYRAGAIKLMAQEYVKNHPELQIKVD